YVDGGHAEIDEHHAQGSQNGADYGVNDERLGAFERARQALDQGLQAQHYVTGHKAAEDGADETGTAVTSEQTDHHARDETRAISDRVGDVAAKDRQHHADGQRAG